MPVNDARQAHEISFLRSCRRGAALQEMLELMLRNPTVARSEENIAVQERGR